MRLVLVGPPGSGKGTQAGLLRERLGLFYIGTGDLLRDAIRRKTDLGRKVEPIIRAGRLVPDATVNELVAELFRQPDHPEKFVCDGYPRTRAQAVSFDALLRQECLDLHCVVLLDVSDEEVVRRMSARRVCECAACARVYNVILSPPKVAGICDKCGCKLIQREDDKVETIRERLRVYHEHTDDLLDHYREQRLLVEIPALQDPNEVHRQIVALAPTPTNQQAG
jgi:adenylate kinase